MLEKRAEMTVTYVPDPGRTGSKISGRWTGVFAVCLVFFFAVPVFAGTEPVTGNLSRRCEKAVVLFLGGLSLADWQAAETPHLAALVERGAMGLMNVRTAGTFNPENAYATFNAGERALSSPEAGEVRAAEETYGTGTAGEAFARRTGVTPPPGALLVMDWPRVLKNNAALPMVLGPGTFGATMAEGGVRVAVLGNADTPAGLGREIALAAMDNAGIVPAGSGAGSTVPTLAAVGVETDYRRLHAALMNTGGRFLVELGLRQRNTGIPLVRPAEEYRQAAAAVDCLGNFWPGLT